MSFDNPDVIIVGGGAGGSTAAYALAKRGFAVTILDKCEGYKPSDFMPFDELHFSMFQALTPSPVNDPDVYVGANGRPRRVNRWWVGNMVGGSSMIWESNLIRFTREDFKVRSLFDNPPSGASLVDWPWSYEEFEPYFERAEDEWGVSGKVGQTPAQEPFRDGYEYPMEPLAPHPSTQFLQEAFGRAGMAPYLGPKGINSTFRDDCPPCPFCGFCQGFGCAITDRAGSNVRVLGKALATGNCELRERHCVTRIDHGDGKVKGVFYKTDPDGPEQYMAASLVIVSVQAIQSARLFLLSEIADPNQLIGHYLTYHTKGSLEVLFPDHEPWDPEQEYTPPWDPDGEKIPYQTLPGLGSLQIRDLYTIDDPQTGLRKGGKFSVYDPYTTGTPISMVDRAGSWGDALVDRLLKLRNHPGAGFSFTGEAMPRYENRVTLDPDVTDPWGLPVARTYYQHHPYDIELSKYALDKIARVLTDAGAEVTKMRAQGADNAGYGHNHGTLRLGTDPSASVLDTQCQSHMVKGLHVLDCAWMPTSGASNPSLTLIANAYRVCENIEKYAD